MLRAFRELDRGRGRHRRRHRRRHRTLRQRLAWLGGEREFGVLCAWLVVVFLLGGSSRDDVQSLMLLRPLSVMVLVYALSRLRREHVVQHRALLALAAAWIGLHLLQLVPLPPQVWQGLPGRGIIVEIDRAMGLGDVWRPLSMVPYGTRNAIWAMLTPFAVLVLGVQLAPERRDQLLPVLLGLGLFSALLAVLQLIGDPDGQIYFYRITNNGFAVGLFANRNHQAVFLATLPAMALVWATLRSSAVQADGRPAALYWACVVGGIVLLTPLILITGSRSGLLVSLFGFVAVPAILWGWLQTTSREAGSSAPNRMRWFGGAAVLLLLIGGLVLLTVILGRGLAIERLLGSDANDMRFHLLGTLFPMIRLYWPWGSGFGSFAEVYRVHEPRALLAPTYVNHAHDDWLELVLTGGLPAVVLALLAALWFLRQFGRLLRPAGENRNIVLIGRLGLLILFMLVLASVGDYPLRVPSLGCLAIVALLWMSPGRLPRAPRNSIS